jgi:DNA-binding NtrC family response regulator
MSIVRLKDTIGNAKSEVKSELKDTSEISIRLHDLDVVHSGLCAKIEQLLKWGSAILLELDSTMKYRRNIESQIDGLSHILDRPSICSETDNTITTFDSVIRETVINALNTSGGNKSEAARILGKSRRAFLRLTEKYGIPKDKRYTKKIDRLSNEL